VNPLHTKDLAPGVDRYLFAEHIVDSGQTSRHHPHDHRSFVVVTGTVAVSHDDGVRAYGPGAGWHAPAGAVYGIRSAGPDPAVVIEAGTANGGDGPAADGDPGGALTDLADYTVAKPWGSETWYTANLDAPGYALKRITMTAGHQSSLQSHRFKAETNYVVAGEATVLSGRQAPGNPDAVVDPADLTVTVHRPGTGWSSPPGELHRVIAHRDYTAIEVSTPELDDVIRWSDDTGRGNGRIDAEHRPEPGPRSSPEGAAHGRR
jgi:quercetin dioxygenase-like cupin family protein